MKNSRSIFWGLFLIVIGILFGLKNFDIVHFHWSNVYRLWPFILVFWGVTLLPLKQNLKIALTLATVIAFFAALILLPPKDYWFGSIDFDSHHKTYTHNNGSNDDDSNYGDDAFHIVQKYEQEIKTGIINIDFGAGDFTLKDSSNDLFEFNAHQLNGKYQANTEIENDKAIVKIKQKKIHIKEGDDFDINARLKVNPDVTWDIDLDVGAANIEMDLKKFKIKKLDFDAGATDIFIELGTLVDTVNVEIDAGLSHIEIIVPKEMSGQIKSPILLVNENFIGFSEIQKGLYQTSDFDTNEKKVFINIDAAAAAITVRHLSE